MWRAPYGKRAAMMIIFNVCQTVGFYGFANWVPYAARQAGHHAYDKPAVFIDHCNFGADRAADWPIDRRQV